MHLATYIRNYSGLWNVASCSSLGAVVLSLSFDVDYIIML